MSKANSPIVEAKAPCEKVEVNKSLINLEKFSQSDKKDNIGKLLSMIELCTNSKKYEYYGSTKTKQFWENVLKEEHLYQIFQSFKPETLKKLWLKIRKCKDTNEFIFLMLKNKIKINAANKSLFYIIESISSYINDDIIDDFDQYFDKFSIIKRSKRRGKINIKK